MHTERRHFYCFDQFRLNATEKVLWRGEELVSLAPKALDTLLVLVRNRGRLLSRDELMRSVWPDSIVEENNVDQQIAALRRAFGQGGNSQIYVETVPKRGYRFVPEVTEEWEKARWAINRRWALIAICIAAFLGIAWLARNWIGRSSASTAPLKNRPTVVVLGFKNLSGNAQLSWLSTALAEMLRTELAMAKKLRTVSNEEVAQTKLDLALPEVDSISPRTLALIRKNLMADIALLGSFTVVGEGAAVQVRVDITVQNTATGEVTASLSRSGNEAKLFDMVADIGATLRKELGEAELTASEAKALKSAYPSNVEAERLYAEGLGKLRALNAVDARPILEKAVSLDRDYAAAYSALAEAWSILGYQAKAGETARKAFELASRLPREPNLVTEAQFRELAAEWDRAILIYQSLWTVFPDNSEYGLHLANAQTSAGKAKDAMLTIQQLRKLSGVDDPRIDLAEAATAEALGDFKGEQSVASQATTKAEARRSRLLMAAALLRESWARNQMGDRKLALAAAERAKAIYLEVGDRAGEARAWKNIADVLDDQGDSTTARDAYEKALATFREIGHEAAVATVVNDLAYGYMDKGDLAGAKRMFEESVAISRKIGDRGREALALNGVANVVWRQGDLDAALKLYEEVVAIHRERGDRARTATVLGNVAIVLQDQGHLDEAKAKFEESLEIIRQIGDKPGLARTLGNLGELLLRKGDLANAKKRFSEHLAVAEEMDDNRQRGYALFGLGEALMAEGDLNGARARHEAGLAVRTKMGAKSVLAESRLALAQLSLEEGKLAETVEQAREAGQQFHREQEIDQEALALATEARALLAQGKRSEADDRANRTNERLPSIQDRAQRIAVLIAVAPVLANKGGREQVMAQLSAAEIDAAKFGYGSLRLEILLAESEADRNPVTAVSRLQTVQREAKAKGYGLIERKAATRLKSAGK